MDSTNSTPFWLEIKKEYIDENIDKVQNYLYNTYEKKEDPFYETTILLLRERIEKLLSDISVYAIYQEDIERKDVLKNLRLLAMYLLSDSGHQLAQTAYVAFLYQLLLYNPRFSAQLINTMMGRLRHEEVTHLGFSWSDLKDIGGDVFIHNLCRYATFKRPLTQPYYYEDYGTACLSANGLQLTYENLAKTRKLLAAGCESLPTGIGICLYTVNSEKYKASGKDCIVNMDEYVKCFIQEQNKVKVKEPAKRKSTYFDEQEALIRITSIEPSGQINVETVDPRYEQITGHIEFEKASILYYYTNTLYRSFLPGDCLKATIVDAVQGIFNIEDQFIEYQIEYLRSKYQEEGSQTEFLCKLIDVHPQQYAWLNEYGIPIITGNTGDFEKDDFAYLTISSFGEGKHYGKVNGWIQYDTDDTFDERSARNDSIRDFAEDKEAPEVIEEKEEIGHLSPLLLRILLRALFFHQKNLLQPVQRYAMLANARIMAELVNDRLSASYISFASTYLRILVQFVSRQDITGIRLLPDARYVNEKSTLVRLSVLEVLKEYGKKGESERLTQTVEDFKTTIPMLSNLAKLIQTSNSMQDILSRSALNIIRREIIKTLSLETEDDADLEADSASYLGIESGTQEFKTSMVYPPNNQMQPDEYTQNCNVLKGICAFLNSTTGGVLYLGVNDSGYVTGIDQDMKYLKMNEIDVYMRYVQDTIIKQFGVDVSPYLRIEPLFDQTVVAIHVEPHPFRVVELNGTAYMRVNAESREMPEQVRLELISRKILKDKNRAAAISQLQHACSKKKRVILHNYASSHTGKISDRLLEAYEVHPDDNLVISFDCDNNDTRVFNINRIGYVETLEDQPWQYYGAHRKVNIDVFHMTGTTPIPVSLQLDLFAKNLLVEEFPRSKDHIQSDKTDQNVWYFDAPVYRLEGIGRFYIGLANHIKILHAPELQEYVKTYKENYL